MNPSRTGSSAIIYCELPDLRRYQIATFEPRLVSRPSRGSISVEADQPPTRPLLKEYLGRATGRSELPARHFASGMQFFNKVGLKMKAYFIGGGIGSLAGAAFLIRDGGVAGNNITIYEKLPLLGGSLDGARLPDGSYSLRGGRMLTTDHYECTWDLLSSIPSLEHPEQTVRDETVAFNLRHKAHSRARLVDRNRFKVDVSKMGFTMQDRMELLRLTEASEEKLGSSRITDWLSPAFFQTNFWYMWQTTFAFQPWHSAVELKRYLHRFMNEFPRIETL